MEKHMEIEIDRIKASIQYLNMAKNTLEEAHRLIPAGAPHLDKVERILNHIEDDSIILDYILQRNYPAE